MKLMQAGCAVGVDDLIGAGNLVRAGYKGRGAFGPPFLLILIKLKEAGCAVGADGLIGVGDLVRAG